MSNAGEDEPSTSTLTQFEFDPSPLPPSTFVNNIYVSLESLVVSKTFKNAKAIGVEIKLLANDEQNPGTADGLAALFTHNLNTGMSHLHHNSLNRHFLECHDKCSVKVRR